MWQLQKKIETTLFLSLTFSELNILFQKKELFLLNDFTLVILFFSLLFSDTSSMLLKQFIVLATPLK